MPQKILAGRSADPLLGGDEVHVKVDQVILSRWPARPMAEALSLGFKKTPVEVAVAYDGTCVTNTATGEARLRGSHETVPPEALIHGILIARPGVGFPAPLHLERFASPARLAVTDDPRMVFVGGIGMLSLVLPPSQLASALATGNVTLRPPKSVQILLSGRPRPFVCARDISLELLRSGLDEVVKKIDEKYGNPVVLEFAGPSARLLSVPERSVLCAIAPAVGAASAVFISDEKSETFLRDQRRSKAHRSLVPDAGAPCDDVVSLDLATVDPLVMDANGEVKPVRDMADTPVRQVILGGDSGITLRDMLAAASLLKSKRVPSRLDFLIAPPSRQILEVLATTGALVDLIATGARLIEPDQRLITGEIYPPVPGEASLRTFDPEPTAHPSQGFIVASAETLAYAVANGQIGDPRSFKRPVRVTVPRVFPTEDVLVIRPRKSNLACIGKKLVVEPFHAFGLNSECDLLIHEGVPLGPTNPEHPMALLAHDAIDLRRIAASATEWVHIVRAVVSSHIPSHVVALLGGMGIAAFGASDEVLTAIRGGKKLTLPAPTGWSEDGMVKAQLDGKSLELRWLGRAGERSALMSGLSAPRKANKPSPR